LSYPRFQLHVLPMFQCNNLNNVEKRYFRFSLDMLSDDDFEKKLNFYSFTMDQFQFSFVFIHSLNRPLHELNILLKYKNSLIIIIAAGQSILNLEKM
jgi:hypothetical protein